MHVVDTDVCVDALRGRVDAVDELEALEQNGPLAVSAVTVHELSQGAHRARDPRKTVEAVERFLAAFDVLPYDGEAARRGGEVAAALKDKGKPIGDLDTMIAATALARGATLVTRNARHFRLVPGLSVHAL